MTKLIDPATGMPQVPEGQFWKVIPALTAGMFRVQLRKKTVFGLSQILGWTLADSPLSEHRVRHAAFSVLDNIEEDKRKSASSQRDAQFVGTYPPKKLGE